MTIVTRNSLTLSNVNDGTITHTAYAYSSDGTDRFTTVCPNLNLLKDGRFSGQPSPKWTTDGTTISKDETTGFFKIKFNGNTVNNRTYYGSAFIEIPTGQKYSISVKAYSLESSLDVKFGAYDGSRTITITNNGNIPKVYKIEGMVKTGSDALSILGGTSQTLGTLFISEIKLEKGEVATPYMPSSSEVTTADWPSYIGQYSDFTATASTDPTKYAPWIIFKGNDGKDGTGIKTTTITYAGSTSGTTVPSSGWTSTIPTVAAGSYLWTKTVWTYTDNTSETGYSVAKMGNDGNNGDPGKIVSDTEPTTRFKGLTWKYLGTSDLTASDGTVIKPNTEYYYNGTHWMINYLSANNLEANSITADLIDAKNLTITDGEFVSTIIDGSVKTQTEIKDDHLLIYKMDTSTNSINTIALKSDSGLAMTHQNSDTGEYTSAGVNFQGLFMQNNITNEFARLTPQGTKLSTDVPWTTLSPMGGFSGGLIRFAVKNGVAHFSLAGLSCPPMTAGNWIKCAQLPSGSIAIPSENQVTAAFTNATVWGFYVSKSGGLYLQSTSNSPALNGLVNASNSYPIG